MTASTPRPPPAPRPDRQPAPRSDPQPAAESGRQPTRLLRSEPDFRRYWLARVVSLGGSMVTYVVLPILVYRMTGSGLWTALVTAAESLPYLCFGLVAGALADRTDRRRLMVGADLLSAVLLVTIPVAHLLGALTPVHVVAVGFGVQALFVFFDAANFGALPVLAGRDRLAAANAAVHGTGTVLELTVPVAAGATIAIFAPAWLLTLDAASFVASALLVRSIRRPLRVAPSVDPPRPGRWRRDIAEGLRFLAGHPVVRVQTVVAVVVCVSFGAFLSQLVPFADRALGLGAEDGRLGLLFAAWGLGGLVASVVFPRLVRAVGEIRVLLASLAVAAAIAVVVAASRHWLFAVVAIAVWSVPNSVAILNSITLRAKVTPDRLQSRVNTAGRMLGFGLGTPIGAAVGGLMSTAYGPRSAFFTVAALHTAAAAVAWLSPLRRLRNDPTLVTVAD